MVVEVFRAVALTTQLDAGSSRLAVYLRFHVAHDGTWYVGSRKFIPRHRFFQRIQMLYLQFVGTPRTDYRTQGSHGTVVQRMYVTIRFVQTDSRIVAQSQVVHIVYKVIGKRQEVGRINLPVHTGKHCIGTLFLVECSELRSRSHSILVACDLQETVAHISCQAVTLLVGSTLDIGDIQRTRVCLMIPCDEEVGTVFYQRTPQ
ncbi:unknown [Bacteroides sp. CAG:1076]|nr:unknown [Bacteroides sp. CAG:1076]